MTVYIVFVVQSATNAREVAAVFDNLEAAQKCRDKVIDNRWLRGYVEIQHFEVFSEFKGE